MLNYPFLERTLPYAGEALRPFGAPLYRPTQHSSPIALRAFKRKSFGRRPKVNLKPYAGYFVRVSTPFAEQPVISAAAPELKRLRSTWLSSWSPNDLNGLDHLITLRGRKTLTGFKRGFVHAKTAKSILGSS